MKYCTLLYVVVLFISCHRKTIAERGRSGKENTWVFIMAGQSNMAGRGTIEAEDTIPDKRIFSIDQSRKLITAKEPLHFYEPPRKGLDCGFSFAKTILKTAPADVTIVMIPAAVGGSSISQWLGDSAQHGIRLYSNFLEKLALAKKFGEVKAILWHQGESDTNPRDIPLYEQRLGTLLSKFRSVTGNDHLPILLGELGSYSNNKANWELLNMEIRKYAARDRDSEVIPTKDLKDKGDHIHFDSAGQRELGKRFADAYLKKFYAGR